MPITPLSGDVHGDEVWGDFSGGEILFSIVAPSYTSFHIFRVLPFDAVGTGLYTAPPAGVVTGIQQDADNLATLIKALYNADTTVSFYAANQVKADHTGVVPYAFIFASSSTVAGTAAGASHAVPNVLNFNSRGSDGSRWRVTFPGYSSTFGSDAVKTPFPVLGGAELALAQYICGVNNGPTHAAKTGLVTHNGVPIAFVGSVTVEMNKRLRRHFRVV